MIDVGGYRVHLYCTGPVGKPVVMILGAGPSFDWSLVQSGISLFARVCTYDPSGTVWSDAGPKSPPTCNGRVLEIHKMLTKADIEGPLVLVGHSMGAVFARLYASHYPADVSGMVLSDHAGYYRFTFAGGPQSGEESVAALSTFAKDMHRWAAASNRSTGSRSAFLDGCIAEAAKLPTQAFPLKEMPLIAIANTSLAGSTDYQSVQSRLLGLSRNSKAVIARTAGHGTPIADPGAIIGAALQVVAAVRYETKLK